MRCTFASLALAAVAAAKPIPDGVSSAIEPSSSAAPACSENYDGTFQIQVLQAGGKRQTNDPLVISLKGGILTDSQDRTGYVASNSQFQFDDPPQAGAIYTAGFAICPNGYLTVGGDSTWYQCKSGTFYNLYDDNVLSTGQCSPVHIKAIGGGAPAGGPSQSAQPMPTSSMSMAPSKPMSTMASASGVATQISDGQVTASAVTQISDGQIQAPSATSYAPVTQISDGQIQAPSSAAPAACSQYVDGQPQCPSGTGYPAPSYGANSSYAAPSASVVPATGAASNVGIGSQLITVVAGFLAVALL